MVERARKLGYYERFYVCRNTKDYYTNLNLVAKYNLNVTSSMLSQALRSMIKKNVWHTYSAFRVEDIDDAEANGHNWELRDVGKIRFSDVVTFEKIKFDKHTLVDINNLKCPMNLENHPLWRIIVFEVDDGSQHICIYFDHMLYDGISAIQFHTDLVKELSEVQNEELFEEYIFDFERDFANFPEKPIASSTDQLDILKPGYFEGITSRIGGYFARFLPSTYFTSKSPFEPNLEINPLYSPYRKTTKNRYQIVNFSPEEVATILRYCKRSKKTLTPYLHAIALQSFEEILYPKVNPNIKFSSKSFVAVNLRRYLPEGSPFKYGVYVSVDSVLLSPILGRVEQVTDLLQKRLEKCLEHGKVANIIRQYNFVNLWNAVKKVSESTDKCSIAFSNIGRISDSSTKYKIVDAVFGSTTGMLYNNVINLVTTKEGGMNVTFVYIQENADYYEGEKEIMQVLAETFKAKAIGNATT